MARSRAVWFLGFFWLVAACATQQADDGQDDQASAGSSSAGTHLAGSGPANAAAGDEGSAGTSSTAGTGAGSAPRAGESGTNANPMGMAGASMEVPGAGAGGGGTDEPIPSGPYDHEAETIELSADLVIASGETLRVGPGTVFNAASGVKVQVDGTLIVEGTAEAPAKFLGAGMPRSWAGIVIASGGNATMRHVEIGGATFGIHAMAGSDFEVSYADIGTSFKAAVVQSDGSFDHTRFHASGDPTFSAVNEVSIEDVNGTLTILEASPTVTHSSFDGGFALVDMVRVGGNASPVFDHVHMKEAHCGIHANGGVNSTPKVTNAVFEGLAYGLMVYATKPSIENSVFKDNGTDLGFCFEATADNAPMLKSNFYSSGAAVIDPSCVQIGTTDSSPSASANPEAGPVGL